MNIKKMFINLFFAFVIVCSINHTACAKTMNVMNPSKVSTGKETIVFLTKAEDTAMDQDRWYTFTPETTGYYSFCITNPYYSHTENDTCLYIYDGFSDAKDEENYLYEDMEKSKDRICLVKFLNEGQIYYININICSCLGINKQHTMFLNIMLHNNHVYEDKVVKPSYYQKGYTERICRECGTSYKINYKSKLTLPKPTKLKLKAGKGQLIVKFNKVNAANGYYIQYSLTRKMVSAKTIRIGSKSIVKKSIKHLKRNKKYYVRVRSYIGSGNRRIYSRWSGIKAIKIK